MTPDMQNSSRVTHWQYQQPVAIISALLAVTAAFFFYFGHRATALDFLWASVALTCLNGLLMARARKIMIGYVVIIGLVSGGFWWWRHGTVVARASFDPGIAPFTVEVRKVPVPVTRSRHFIVSLYRGQYVVTSFRYFWPGYTPSHVTIAWPCIDTFTVTFDEQHVATCHWRWGQEATWSMSEPTNGPKPGLSPYFFTPRNPPPSNCPSSDAS